MSEEPIRKLRIIINAHSFPKALIDNVLAMVTTQDIIQLFMTLTHIIYADSFIFGHGIDFSIFYRRTYYIKH